MMKVVLDVDCLGFSPIYVAPWTELIISVRNEGFIHAQSTPVIILNNIGDREML